jgi:hypothetical protein
MLMNLLFNTTEPDAVASVGISPVTLKKRRLIGDIPTHFYAKIGRECLRYCLSLLLHWQQNTHDPAAYDRLRLWLHHYPAISQPERGVNRQQPGTDTKNRLSDKSQSDQKLNF